MLKSLHISGFRCFRELRVEPLTRVNLFVGKNNSGKTSILEAAEILAAGVPQALWRSPLRRKEQILVRDDNDWTEEADPSHLFYGHDMRPGVFFGLRDPTSEAHVQCEVKDDKPEPSPGGPPILALESALVLDFGSNGSSTQIPLSPNDGLPFRRFRGAPELDLSAPVEFQGTEQPDSRLLRQLWYGVALTPKENEIIEALKLIEPGIERIAFLGEGIADDFFLLLAGSEQRIPLGSVGDGLKRLLALTLHLQAAKGGVLLVDEVDTGLHYTVLEKMWRLVIATAKRLDLQVLATTHSLDCVHALATVYESDPELAAEVTLHRVERDQPVTVSYQPEEIAVAAELRIEVR